MEVLLANPRGFCAGVERAIAIVERALALHGAPIYVRHEVVHNKYVVDDLRSKGAIFIEDLDEVPPGSTLIFSAHGVSKAVRAEADTRGLKVFDATCPLVTKVHVEVARMHDSGREIIMIGHRGHPEVEGTMGQAADGMHLVETAADVARLQVRNPEQLAYVTQTTLSVDDAAIVVAALKTRFPFIVGPKKDDICYATQNRQDAVKFMVPHPPCLRPAPDRPVPAIPAAPVAPTHATSPAPPWPMRHCPHSMPARQHARRTVAGGARMSWRAAMNPALFGSTGVMIMARSPPPST